MQFKNLLRLAVVTSIVVAAIFVTPAQSANAAGAGDFLGRINALRASKGLGALTLDSRLSSFAQSWTQTMASRNAISHNPALGSTPGNWTKVGENVGTGGDVNSIFNALVASPGHYKNMVEGSFNTIGIGVATGSDGRLYTTHNFAAYPGASASSSSGQSNNSNTSATSKPKAARSAAPATSRPAAPKPRETAPARPAAEPKPVENTPSTPAPSQVAAKSPEAPTAAAPVAVPTPVVVPSAQIVQGYTELANITRQG